MARAQPHRTVSIYVFEVPGFRKIGIAADVERRRDQVQAMNPCQVRLMFVRHIPAETARWIEAHVHRSLRDKRVRGEWFKCTLREAITAILDGMTAGHQESARRRGEDREFIAEIARDRRGLGAENDRLNR